MRFSAARQRFASCPPRTTPPTIFSTELDSFVEISPELVTSFPPLGTIPSEHDIDRTRTKSVLGFKGPLRTE